MKNILKLAVVLAFFLSGCVMIALPGVEPLKEKSIAGEGKDKILLIDISGIITENEDSNVFGVQTKQKITARVKEEVSRASEDEDVKAVILRINTPGGSVTTCDIIRHEIQNLKKKRNIPVVAEFMDVAASGGYYIASAADVIVAHPTTVTGSIGVIAFNVNASGLMDKLGLTNQSIKSGDKKDIGTPLRPMTEDERQILQSIINGMYDRFLDVILEGRNKSFSREELRKIADGRIYTASQAKDLKLVDSIGYLDDAIEAAKEKAGIKEARVITYTAPRAYKNNIYSMMEQPPAEINLINIDTGFRKPGLSFMYLWMP
ncbi:MAG: signal peptide peptidase SppA [Deltaproteobacteria bacterium]|nr:signal peptide peptidase SppA [Deltaproteobacteria bacterium]